MFKVSSGLGKYQFTKSSRPSTPSNAMKSSSSKSSTSTSSMASKPSRQSNVYVKSDQDIIKQNNNELIMLKENYMKLRDQYQSEKQSYVNKLLNLQNDLNSEQKRVKSLQAQLDDLTHNNKIQDFYQTNGKSIAVIENIWNLMQSYHDAIQGESNANRNGVILEDHDFISQNHIKSEIDDSTEIFSLNQNQNYYKPRSGANNTKGKGNSGRKFK